MGIGNKRQRDPTIGRLFSPESNLLVDALDLAKIHVEPISIMPSTWMVRLQFDVDFELPGQFLEIAC